MCLSSCFSSFPSTNYCCFLTRCCTWLNCPDYPLVTDFLITYHPRHLIECQNIHHFFLLLHFLLFHLQILSISQIIEEIETFLLYLPFICLKLSVLGFRNNYFFKWIPGFAADAFGVNRIDIKPLLTNGLSALFINGKPVFNNGLYKTYCFK